MKPTLFTIPGFLSAGECAALVRDTEQRGFTPAPVTTGFGFVMMPELRNNTRVMIDDVELAERLWARLHDRSELYDVDVWRPVSLNERFRFYKYTAGQAFRWHRDGAFIRNDSEQSLLTFMIYLNEGFVGGASSSTPAWCPSRATP
jgi:prolyl 4-hydroxylase